MKRILLLLLAAVAAASVSAMDYGESQQPLYVVDGKAISAEEVKAIASSEIESMTVIRDQKQLAQFKHLGDVSNGVIVVTLKDKEQDDIHFIAVDVMPSFMGGDLNTFRMWVMQNIRYPEVALEQRLQDMVVVKFVVNREGYIEQDGINVLQSNHPDIFVDEVKRVFTASPRWTPGIQKGSAVAVSLVLPVAFQLAGEDSAVEIDGMKIAVEGADVEEIVVRAFSNRDRVADGEAMMYVLDGVPMSVEEFKSLSVADIKQVTLYAEGDSELEYYKHFGDVSRGVMVIKTYSPEVEKNPDTEPIFMNSGWDGFHLWVCQNLRLPEELKNTSFSSQMVVKFVINDGGYVELTDIVTVVGTPHPLLHSELRRVMLSSPQWQPATKDGRAVAFEATLPVTIAN
ncbi:MAG: hypothetical protein E7146_05725 [Rikenellaceae bacterium]|nr:hypothetical protein [Rikenellaceae bacterium]